MSSRQNFISQSSFKTKMRVVAFSLWVLKLLSLILKINYKTITFRTFKILKVKKNHNFLIKL